MPAKKNSVHRGQSKPQTRGSTCPHSGSYYVNAQTHTTEREPHEAPRNMDEFVRWCEERGLRDLLAQPQQDFSEVMELVAHCRSFGDGTQSVWLTNISNVPYIVQSEPVPMPGEISAYFDDNGKPKGLRPYKIMSAANLGSGLGMYASTDIGPGQVLLRERPTIVITTTLAVPCEENKHEFYNVIGEKLQETTKNQVMALANCKAGQPGIGELEGRVRTNSFFVELTNSPDKAQRNHAGVFLETSRINHSCSPNTQEVWHAESGMMYTMSKRALAKDEELTISYTDITETRAVRRKRLHLMYGFDCACSYCDLPDEEATRKSDERRMTIKRWRTGSMPQLMLLEKWHARTKSTDKNDCPLSDGDFEKFFLHPWENLAACWEDEGLTIPIAILRELVRGYGYIGDREQFTRRLVQLKHKVMATYCEAVVDALQTTRKAAVIEGVMNVFESAMRRFEECIEKPELFAGWKQKGR